MVHAKRRVTRQEFLFGGALGKTVEYHRNGNASPRCANLTAADLWATTKKLVPRHHTSSLRGRCPGVQQMISLLRPVATIISLSAEIQMPTGSRSVSGGSVPRNPLGYVDPRAYG